MGTHMVFRPDILIIYIPSVEFSTAEEGITKDPGLDFMGMETSATIPGSSAPSVFRTSISVRWDRNLLSSAPAKRDTFASKCRLGRAFTVNATVFSGER